jgi:hypothetical protein
VTPPLSAAATVTGRAFRCALRPGTSTPRAWCMQARYYELSEDAFLAWLEHACGRYLALQASGGDLVIVENGCTYRHPARQNDR